MIEEIDCTPEIETCQYGPDLFRREPRVTVWSEHKTETQYRAEMVNMLEHGVTSPTTYEGNFERFVRTMKIREEVGLPRGNVHGVGTSFPKRELDSDEALAAFIERIRPFIEWANANGYTYYSHGLDEDDHSLPKERRFIEAVHEMGGKIFQATNADGGFFELAGDILDQPILAGSFNPDIARRVREAGHTLGIYANPQVGSEAAETYRRNYGIALWQAGYGVFMDYAYQHSFGHAWNDFDSEAHKDHLFAYPTIDGVIDTLSWEGLREAVDDVRYVATLIAVAEAVTDDSPKRTAADAALTWIREVDTNGDLDAVRGGIIDRILDLSQ